MDTKIRVALFSFVFTVTSIVSAQIPPPTLHKSVDYKKTELRKTFVDVFEDSSKKPNTIVNTKELAINFDSQKQPKLLAVLTKNRKKKQKQK